MATEYCRPSDILTPSATITVTAGTEDATYPRTNLQDKKAHTVAKFTGTTGTFRATFGASKTLQAVAFINTNATAIQLTNGAGLNQAVAIPSAPADGLRLDPWIDLRGLANTASTQWNVALTGAAGVGLGELLLIETLRTLSVRLDFDDSEEHPASIVSTDYRVRLKYGMGVRQRAYQVTAYLESERNDVLALQRDARGAYYPFLFLLDSTVNDALFVDLTTPGRTFRRRNAAFADMVLLLTEQQKGLL